MPVTSKVKAQISARPAKQSQAYKRNGLSEAVFDYLLVRGAEFESLLGVNKITLRCLHPSTTRPRSEAQRPANIRPTPRTKSIRIQQPSQVTPGPASKRRQPRSFNRETLSSDHGPRLLSRLLSKIGRWLTVVNHDVC